MKSFTYSDNTRKAAARDLVLGLSHRAIAKKYNVHPNTVRNWLKRGAMRETVEYLHALVFNQELP